MPDDVKPPGKGCFGGECNRTACHSPDARYYNRYTHAYYCKSCARRIDVAEAQPWQVPCFDYPLKADEADRHSVVTREAPYAVEHPDKNPPSS